MKRRVVHIVELGDGERFLLLVALIESELRF